MELVSKRTVALGNTLLYVFDYSFLTISDIGDTLLCSPSDFAMVYILKTVLSTPTKQISSLRI
ncbi:hypothetical protein [Flavobacterium sp. W20_MBD1_R3]|uniref:hypothetical protein n=1 Tax=Flavobacterium sp. W20_MBD1_R3 TaxID=3240278 RepID=UPI003F930AC4